MIILDKTYKVDEAKKKFIKKKDFKKTYKWRQLKPKRIKGWLLILLAIVLCFSFIFIPNEWFNYIAPIICFAVGSLFFVGATMIKAAYTDAKMIETRYNEQIRLLGQYLEYRYELPLSKSRTEDKRITQVVVIPYDGIENAIYSTYLHKLILECYFTTRKEKKSSGGSKLPYISNFERTELEVLEIPMYFENEDDFLLRLGLLSNREILVLETEMEKFL